MNVQQISFNNNLNQPEQKINSGLVAFASTPDKFESSNKKDNTGKYILAGLGVVAVIIAIVKHKQIGEFLNKLFKRGEKAGNEVKSSKSPIKDTPPVVLPKPKFELPKPEFKYDKTNPVEFAKEKENYINSIVGYASRDEQTAIGVINQFDKYGSRENLMNLATTLSLSKNKTDKIVQGYLKLYQKYARLNIEDPSECDASLLRFVLKEFQKVISKESIKLMIIEFKRTGKDSFDLGDLSGFTKSSSHYFMRKFSPEDIDEIDKLAQDAETVVRKRVYKD